MKLLQIVPIALLLSACASTTEIRNTNVVATYSSKLPAKTVSKCVLSNLEPMFSMASVQYRDTETGASVWVEMRVGLGKDTAVMIDTDDAPTGSSTKLYSRVLAGESKYRTAIESCVA